MKLWVSATFEIDDTQKEILLKMARSSGHDFDNCKNERIIIRRYLISQMTDAVIYCHERIDKD